MTVVTDDKQTALAASNGQDVVVTDRDYDVSVSVRWTCGTERTFQKSDLPRVIREFELVTDASDSSTYYGLAEFGSRFSARLVLGQFYGAEFTSDSADTSVPWAELRAALIKHGQIKTDKNGKIKVPKFKK